MLDNKCGNINCRFNKQFTCLKDNCKICILWQDYYAFFGEDFDDSESDGLENTETFTLEELEEIEAAMEAFKSKS